MNLQITFYTLLIFAIGIPQVRAVFYEGFKKALKINESESFSIPFDSLDIPPKPTDRYQRPKSGRKVAIYKNATRDYSPDERCEKGLHLGMSISDLPPYVLQKFDQRVIPARNITRKNG